MYQNGLLSSRSWLQALNCWLFAHDQALAAAGISVHQRGLAVCRSFELFGRRSGLGWATGHGFLLLQRRKVSSRLEFGKRNDRKM